jgi:cellulose synthase/poly-beta-1,6-N-acetylglucosamine synthase-like glycosyltransferase
MPIYNEKPASLIEAVQSIIDVVYPKESIVVYLSFDSEEESPLFMCLMEFLTNKPFPMGGYPRRTVITHANIIFVINRFSHGGKRNVQAMTYKEIVDTYKGMERGIFVILIDSDIILYPDCLLEFLHAMENNRNLVGMTGYISPMLDISNIDHRKPPISFCTCKMLSML